MSGLEICGCDLNDLSELVQIENECFEQPYSQKILAQMLQNRLATVLLARVDGIVAGYIALERAFDEAELTRIAVKKSLRRGGIAGKLIEFAVKKMLGSVKKIFLEVDETNCAALCLYKNCDFSIIAERKKYYGERAAVIMQKNL